MRPNAESEERGGPRPEKEDVERLEKGIEKTGYHMHGDAPQRDGSNVIHDPPIQGLPALGNPATINYLFK